MLEPDMAEKDLIYKLLEALQELPQVRARSLELEHYASSRDFICDAAIELGVGQRSFHLFVEVKKSLYPRDVRESLWQIKEFALSNRLNGADAAVPLLAAESISPGAKDLLRKENVGYFDSGGSLFIPASGAYFYIDKPPPKPFSKTVRSLFKGKRSQVLHTLLVHADEWFNVKKLADQADVSSATASQTLSSLERFDWISSKGQGPSKERRLSEPAALLDEWGKLAATQRLTYRRYYVPSMDADKLADELDRVCGQENAEYVLTQEIAAQAYAPFLTSLSQVKCRIVPGPAAAEAISELGARVVTEGANLLVNETKSEGEFLFKSRKGNVFLASPVQVYLDLLRGGGRAGEMAEHLRKEKIGF